MAFLTDVEKTRKGSHWQNLQPANCSSDFGLNCVGGQVWGNFTERNYPTYPETRPRKFSTSHLIHYVPIRFTSLKYNSLETRVLGFLARAILVFCRIRALKQSFFTQTQKCYIGFLPRLNRILQNTSPDNLLRCVILSIYVLPLCLSSSEKIGSTQVDHYFSFLCFSHQKLPAKCELNLSVSSSWYTPLCHQNKIKENSSFIT